MTVCLDSHLGILGNLCSDYGEVDWWTKAGQTTGVHLGGRTPRKHDRMTCWGQTGYQGFPQQCSLVSWLRDFSRPGVLQCFKYFEWKKYNACLINLLDTTKLLEHNMQVLKLPNQGNNRLKIIKQNLPEIKSKSLYFGKANKYKCETHVPCAEGTKSSPAQSRWESTCSLGWIQIQQESEEW